MGNQRISGGGRDQIKNSLSALLDEGDKRIRVLTESGETVLDAQMDTEEAP